jgi:hypothetical protein
VIGAKKNVAHTIAAQLKKDRDPRPMAFKDSKNRDTFFDPLLNAKSFLSKALPYGYIQKLTK